MQNTQIKVKEVKNFYRTLNCYQIKLDFHLECFNFSLNCIFSTKKHLLSVWKCLQDGSLCIVQTGQPYFESKKCFIKKSTNIFGDLSVEKKNIIHKTLNFLILSTDMDLHKDRIDQLLEIKTTDVNADKISSEYVDTISMALIKLCDLSNEFRPFKIFKEIHASLIEEFRQQVFRKEIF